MNWSDKTPDCVICGPMSDDEDYIIVSPDGFPQLRECHCQWHGEQICGPVMDDLFYAIGEALGLRAA